MPEREKEIDHKLLPEGYNYVSQFEKLGGDKGDSNFIAVVHIDGNAMGHRVDELYAACRDMEWEEFKKQINSFSLRIDEDFKSAYYEMALCVARNLSNGKLSNLKLADHAFPVRRIITAGDDICFVTEGRIGLECAAFF